MKIMVWQSGWVTSIAGYAERSAVRMIIFCICLSWFYALCSQCLIPLSFNFVPITLQSVMFLFCANLFGRKAVSAYVLYLIQGALGAPFFSRFGSGLVHLLGPTGGYLIGFIFAMFVIAFTRGFAANSKFWLLIRYWFCCTLYYVFGLLQLAWFVPSYKVLTLGLYPFIFGDFVIKAVFFLFLTSVFRGQRS